MLLYVDQPGELWKRISMLIGTDVRKVRASQGD